MSFFHPITLPCDFSSSTYPGPRFECLVSFLTPSCVSRSLVTTSFPARRTLGPGRVLSDGPCVYRVACRSDSKDSRSGTCPIRRTLCERVTCPRATWRFRCQPYLEESRLRPWSYVLPTYNICASTIPVRAQHFFLQYKPI